MATKNTAAKSAPAPQEEAAVTVTEMPRGYKQPKTLAGAADMLYSCKLQRSAHNKEGEVFGKIESALTTRLIAELPEGEANGIIGKMAMAEVVPFTVGQPENWDKIYAYILKTGDFSILNKALNQAALKERQLAKKLTPGVKYTKLKKVSITKRKGGK